MMNFKKTKTAKVVSGFVGVSTALLMLGPVVASAAALSAAQVSAIVSLLQSFGADATTIANVQGSLTGMPVTTPAAPAAGAHTFSVDLTVGSKGDDVVALQQILVSGGYLTMPAGVAMGYFGNATKAAVAKWQAAAGIAPAAGYVGPKSRAALSAMGGSTPTTPTNPGTTPVAPGAVSAMLDTSVPTQVLITGQGVATLAGFKISNGSSMPLKVTMVKFKRTGISADTTLNNVYLYQGSTRITDSASVSTGVVNFSDSAGLVVVPAMSAVTLLVRADIASGTNGQTVGVMLTDVTTDAGAMAGLPVSGPELNIAAAPSGMSAADFTSAATTPTAGSIDPQVDFVVWQKNLSVNQRDVTLSTFRIQQIGSAYTDDLQNFRLMVDGVQVGAAVAKADANRFVTFTASPAVTVKTGSHVIKVMADIVGGSNRSFQYSLRRVVDIELWDSQLGIVVTPTVASASFSAIDAGAMSVNAGTLTITKATDSPSGNVVLSGSGLTLAKFKVKAQGEKLKIENLRVSHTAGDINGTWTKIRNGALFLDGAQIGSTADILEDSFSTGYTQFNLGSSMVLDAGKEYTLEVRGDVYNNGATGQLLAGTTTVVNIAAGSTNVYRMSSLSYISNSAQSGSTITVAAGSLALAKYSAYANQTVTTPQTAYKIGEWRLTSGSTEGVNLDTLTLTIAGDLAATTTDLTNLYIVYGSKTSVTKAAAASSQSWSINEVIPANGTMNVALYGNLSSAVVAGKFTAGTLTVSGTTQSAGTAVSSSAVAGQTITVASGSLTTAVDASTPVSANVVGLSMPKVASFKYNALNDSFTLNEIGVTVGSSAGASAISELVFKDGATELKRVAMNGTAATATGLTVPVAYNGSKVIDVYANLGAIGTGFATTSANVAVTLSSTKYINSNGSTLWENTSRAGQATYAFKTKPTITNVSLPTTVLTTGTMTVAKFTITADAAGTIAWRKLILTVATSTPSGSLYVTGYNIYDSANESTVLSNTTPTVTTGSTVTFNSTSDQEVSGSKTYVVKATVGGSPATSASVSHNIAVGQSSVQSPNQSALVAGSPTFVWSDESVVGHDGSTGDWMGDFLVKNIPTDSQTLTK